jgi:hypothetical protein
MPMASTPLDEAQQLYRMGEFERAIDRYQKIISGGPDDAAAYAGLARIYLKLKKPDEAFAAATKAVEHDPSLATAHSALGEVYLRQGKLYEAQQEFLVPFKMKQLDARAYLGLSRLYRGTFNFKRAKVTIDKAYGLDPSDPDISGAWMDTRPRSEQLKSLENAIDAQSNFYSSVEKARFKQRLALMKDRTEHPERTCSLANRPDTTQLPLQPISLMGIESPGGLDVRVNGKAARLTLVTTGSAITINEQIAKKAGVQLVARTDVDGLGDQNPPEAYIGFVPSITVGNLEFDNCYVTVIERASPGSLFTREEGAISARLFSQYLVDLDFPKAKLKLQPLPSRLANESPEGLGMDTGDPDAEKSQDRYKAPEMAAWVEMYNFGGRSLVPVHVNDSPPKLFDLSATTPTFVAANLAENATEMLGKTAPPQASKAFGPDGIIGKTYGAGPVKLVFGTLYYVAAIEPSVDFSMSSDQAGTEISGVLGFDAMHNCEVQIDYRDGLIQFSNGEKQK